MRLDQEAGGLGSCLPAGTVCGQMPDWRPYDIARFQAERLREAGYEVRYAGRPSEQTQDDLDQFLDKMLVLARTITALTEDDLASDLADSFLELHEHLRLNGMLPNRWKDL